MLDLTAEDSDDAYAIFSSPCVPTTYPVIFVVGLGFFGLVFQRNAFRLKLDDFQSPRMRITWPNLIAFFSVPLETLQLIALVLHYGWPNGDDNDTNGDNVGSDDGGSNELPTILAQAVKTLSFGSQSLREAVLPTAVLVALSWALITTLPIADREESRRDREGQRNQEGGHSAALHEYAEDLFNEDGEVLVKGTRGHGKGSAIGSGGVGAAPIFRHLTSFLGGFCFISLVLVMQPYPYSVMRSEDDDGAEDGNGDNQPKWLLAAAAVLLLFYLITTQVLSADSALLTQSQDCGIDVR